MFERYLSKELFSSLPGSVRLDPQRFIDAQNG
jgi:hypothetical protein